MAIVKVFRNRKNLESIVVCPFVRHPQGGMDLTVFVGSW